MNTPEKGFYYHYKHDPNGTVNNYAYEVMGVGHHTEDDSLLVMYRPIYEGEHLDANANAYLRPREIFLEEVTKEGKTFPRFRKITDPAVIAELENLRDQMYQ